MISKITLGTAKFGMDYGLNSIGRPVELSEVLKILDFARTKRINFLDTALAYGHCEKVLGDANCQDFEIISKTRTFKQKFISNKEISLLTQDFSNSLQLLNQSSIYGLLVHNADDLFKNGSDKIYNQLNHFKKQGLVKKIGVSIYTDAQLIKIIEMFDFDIIQLPVNILDHRLIRNGLLDKISKLGIEVHARSVFLQGLILLPKNDIPKKFQRWSPLWEKWHDWLNDNNLTPLEASIRFPLSQKEVSKVIIGIDNRKQLEEVLMASNGILPEIPSDLFVDDFNLLNPSNWTRL